MKSIISLHFNLQLQALLKPLILGLYDGTSTKPLARVVRSMYFVFKPVHKVLKWFIFVQRMDLGHRHNPNLLAL